VAPLHGFREVGASTRRPRNDHPGGVLHFVLAASENKKRATSPQSVENRPEAAAPRMRDSFEPQGRSISDQ
jgi:hypothetical protein